MNKESRGERIYNYQLYSFKRFLTFLKYAKLTAKELSKKEKISESFIVMDMVWCNLRYGALHSRDYTLFDFVKKSAHERNTFMTFRRYYRMVKKLDKDTFLRLSYKDNVYHDYKQFISRDWLLIDRKVSRDEIIDFLSRHNTVIVKPVSSDQGNGIYKATVNTSQEKHTLCEKIVGKEVILEESLCNCIELNCINQSSLNTVRVYTIIVGGKAEIATMALRCGRNEAEIDNWGAGGVGYNIDKALGVIDRPGRDKKGEYYIIHPGTNICMVGFQIPQFLDVCQFALRIANYNKKVLFAGLDIAITPQGPELIEVNFPGGHDFLQCLDGVGKNELLQSMF